MRWGLVVALVGLAACEAADGTAGEDGGEVSVATVDVADDADVGAGDTAATADAAPDGLDAPDVADLPDMGDGGDADTALAEVDAAARDFGPPVDDTLAAELAAVLADRYLYVQAAAVAVGVRLPDGSWWEGVVGEACHEPRRAAVTGDRFRLGSITKTYVAAAVLQLVDEGQVGLDDAIDDHVPGFGLEPEITVRRCLSHTTGIFDLVDDVLSVEGDFSQPIAPREIVSQALEHPRLFAPGQGYSYSNTNYFLLGLLLEEVGGEPIAQVLRERLLDPQGLLDTFMEDAEPARTTFVCGNAYDIDVTELLDMSWTWAAGAMVSSTGDLCRWADALWRGDVLPDGLRAAMVTPTVLPDGRVVGYGLGTKLVTRGGLPVVGHNGQTLGFQSELYIDPASGLCVAVLANDFGATPESVGVPVWDLLVPALSLP